MIYDIQYAYQRSIQCISPTRKAWTLRSRWSLSYIHAEPLAIEAFFLELIIQNRSTVWDSDSIAPSYPSCQSYLTKKRTSKKFAELICDTTVHPRVLPMSLLRLQLSWVAQCLCANCQHGDFARAIRPSGHPKTKRYQKYTKWFHTKYTKNKNTLSFPPKWFQNDFRPSASVSPTGAAKGTVSSHVQIVQMEVLQSKASKFFEQRPWWSMMIHDDPWWSVSICFQFLFPVSVSFLFPSFQAQAIHEKERWQGMFSTLLWPCLVGTKLLITKQKNMCASSLS